MSVILELYQKYEDVFRESLFSGEQSREMNNFICGYALPIKEFRKWNILGKLIYKLELSDWEYRVSLALFFLDMRFTWEELICNPDPIKMKLGRLLYLTKDLNYHKQQGLI